MQISVRDRSATQAAKIANTIAEVYQEDRLTRLRQQSEAGIRALEERWNQQKAESDKAVALVFRLRDELRVSATEETGWSKRMQTSTNGMTDKRVLELRPFDEARLEMEKAIQRTKEFEKRVAIEKIDQTLPRAGVVTILTRAVPPETPIFPTHKQTLIILLSGLVMMAVGGVLLHKAKPARA